MRTVLSTLAFCVIAACSGDEPAPEPLVLNAHGMAYDEARDRIVVFGGATETAVSGLTYEWQGDGWLVAATDGPEPRTFPAMAYAGAHGGTVLFGGNRVLFGTGLAAENLLSDTWIWDGERWKHLPGGGPGPRAEAAMAYDYTQDRLLLFGGYHIADNTIVPLGDTWAFDGTSWSKLSDTGPPPQNGASMSFDAVRQSMILFGQNADRTTGETWEWREGNWQHLQKGQSDRRYNSAMTYDANRGQIVRFGGWTGEGRADDTWIWSQNGWERAGIAGPPARNHAQLIYSPAQQKLFLFGGHDGENIFGDIWTFDGESWQLLMAVQQKPRIPNNH